MQGSTTVPDSISADIADAYREHGYGLMRFATVLVGPDDAPDVVSSAMLRVLELAPVRVDSPRAYLYQAIANQARNHRRGEARRRLRDHRAAESDGSYTTKELYPEVRTAVERLSVRQRAVVYLTYWEDLSENDVAEHLGIAVGSVRRHLFRAKRHLRRALDDHDR